jgi:hypothetical protein
MPRSLMGETAGRCRVVQQRVGPDVGTRSFALPRHCHDFERKNR